MEFRDYLRVLRSSALLIVVLLLLGAVAGGAFAALKPKQYEATAQAFVSVTSAQSLSDLTNGALFSNQAAQGYADIARTAYVLQPVIDSLDLRTTPRGLGRRVDVAVSGDSPVIAVTVTDAFAPRAAKTANAIVAQLSTAAISLAPDAGGGATADAVRLTAVDPAVVDRTPVGLRLPLGIAVGAAAGLIVAVLLGLLRDLLDTRIRTRQDLDRVTDVPVIGTTFRDPRIARSPLVVDGSGGSPAAEAYRSLRTNLLFLGLDDLRRSLVLTSSVEGEGKSTTAANLALAVSSLGGRVLLVDADLRRPRIAQLFGIEGAVGLTDVLIGAATLEQAVQPFGRDGLEILPAGTIPPNPNEQMQSAAMHDLVSRLHGRYDLVLFDTPPVLAVSDAALLGRLAGGVLLVAAAGRVRRPQLEAAVESLERVGAGASGVVMTMLPRSGQDAHAYGYGYAEAPAARPASARERRRPRDVEAAAAPSDEPPPARQDVPVDTEEPVESVESARSADPVGLIALLRRAETEEPVPFGGSAEPVESVEPIEPVEFIEPAAPVERAEPVEQVEPAPAAAAQELPIPDQEGLVAARGADQVPGRSRGRSRAARGGAREVRLPPPPSMRTGGRGPGRSGS